MANVLPNDYEFQKRVAAWNRASTVVGYDARIYRKDSAGFWIKWSDYGNRDAEYGWEVDHIHPLSKGGRDALDNVQALHWRANVAKSDK